MIWYPFSLAISLDLLKIKIWSPSNHLTNNSMYALQQQFYVDQKEEVVSVEYTVYYSPFSIKLSSKLKMSLFLSQWLAIYQIYCRTTDIYKPKKTLAKINNAKLLIEIRSSISRFFLYSTKNSIRSVSMSQDLYRSSCKKHTQHS